MCRRAKQTSKTLPLFLFLLSAIGMSGCNSLNHQVRRITVASFDPATGEIGELDTSPFKTEFPDGTQIQEIRIERQNEKILLIREGKTEGGGCQITAHPLVPNDTGGLGFDIIGAACTYDCLSDGCEVCALVTFRNRPCTAACQCLEDLDLTTLPGNGCYLEMDPPFVGDILNMYTGAF